MASNIKIFLLEDEALVRESLVQSLGSLGYVEIESAKNSEEAHNLLKKQAFDIALLDIGIKDSKEDGIGIASHINIVAPRTKIIFISSYSDHQTILRTERIIVSNYLVKPVSDRQLYVAIEKALCDPSRKDLKQLDDRIFLKGPEKFYEKVLYKDILWIKGESTGTRIKTKDADIFTYNILSKIMDQISDPSIVRVHKSHAVNVNNVTGVSDNELELEDGNSFSVGGTYRKTLEDVFNKINPKPSR